MISVPDAAQLPSVPRPMRRLELLHDLGRKAVRIERKRLCQMNAHHLPMSGGGVFARRRQRASSESRGGPVDGPDVRQRLQIAQAELREIRQVQLAGASDIAQRVAARVAIRRRIRHLADADAVQHDPDDATETELSLNNLTALRAGRGLPSASFTRVRQHIDETVRKVTRSCG